MFKLFFKYSCEFDGKVCECEPAIVFFKVSCKSISAFRDIFIEEFRKSFFGEDWQSGDSGATYQMIEENIVICENDDSLKTEFVQNGAKFFLEKNGKLDQVEFTEFETATDSIAKK